MSLIKTIRNNLQFGKEGAVLLSELPEEYPAWTILQRNFYGVALPLLGEFTLFSEEFSKVKVWSQSDVSIAGTVYNLLFLTCGDTSLKDEFSAVCAQFVDPGDKGEARLALCNDPESWWRDWKHLLGNSDSDASIYPDIGELCVLEKLWKSGRSASWTGAHAATHDIELADCSYEVKSTTKRQGYTATISSQHQLLAMEGKSLSLVFCRFERSLLGRCVDDYVKSLVTLGYPEDELERVLEKKGLEKGRTARNLRYKLLEMMVYPVDENFPKITKFSFKDDVFPKGIGHITYDVDLGGLTGKSIL